MDIKKSRAYVCFVQVAIVREIVAVVPSSDAAVTTKTKIQIILSSWRRFAIMQEDHRKCRRKRKNVSVKSQGIFGSSCVIQLK